MTPTQRYRIILALQNIQNALKEATQPGSNHEILEIRGNIFIKEIIDIVNHVKIIEDKSKKN